MFELPPRAENMNRFWHPSLPRGWNDPSTHFPQVCSIQVPTSNTFVGWWTLCTYFSDYTKKPRRFIVYFIPCLPEIRRERAALWRRGRHRGVKPSAHCPRGRVMIINSRGNTRARARTQMHTCKTVLSLADFKCSELQPVKIDDGHKISTIRNNQPV